MQALNVVWGANVVSGTNVVWGASGNELSESSSVAVNGEP
jgi:hypothetical protein